MGFLNFLGNPLGAITKPAAKAVFGDREVLGVKAADIVTPMAVAQSQVDKFAGAPSQVAYDSEGNLLSVEESKKRDTGFRNLVGQRFGSQGKNPIEQGPAGALSNSPFVNWLQTGKFKISPKTEEEQLARQQMFS